MHEATVTRKAEEEVDRSPAHWLGWGGTDISDWSPFCLVNGGHRTVVLCWGKCETEDDAKVQQAVS